MLTEKVDKGSVKTRAASTKPQADCLPALATNDGQVVMDAAAQARRIGLSAGCAVLVESDKREAVFLQLCEGGAEVRFVQVAEDGAAQESVRIVPLAELAVLPKGDTKKPKAVRVVDTRQPGTEWSLMTDTQVEHGIHDFVKSMLMQLQGSLSPAKELLRWHEEADGAHFSLNYAVKAGSLIFVPFTQVLSDGERAVKRRRSNKSSDDSEHPLLRVRKTDVKAEPMYLSLEPAAGPFWTFLQEEQHQSQDVPNLAYKIMKTQASQSGAVQFAIEGKTFKKSSKMSLELSFPVLTNPDDLPAFTVLRASCSGLPSIKDA